MAVFEELSNASEFEEQIANLQGQIDGLDDTYATDTDIQGLQGQIDTLEETVAGLGSGGSGGVSVKTVFVEKEGLYNFLSNNQSKILYITLKPHSGFYINCTKIDLTSTGTTFGTGQLTPLFYTAGKTYDYNFYLTSNSNYTFYLRGNSSGIQLLLKCDSSDTSLRCDYTTVSDGKLTIYNGAYKSLDNVSIYVTYIE